MDDLRAQVKEHADDLAAVMVTYPSTHGVFEQEITRAVRPGPRRRRAGLRRRRQPQRAGRGGAAGRLRRRRVAPEPAQDVLHPARWWRARRRTGRRARPPGALPAEPSAAARCRTRDRRRADRRGAVGFRRHPADLVGLPATDGGGGPDPRDAGRDPERQLRRGPAGARTSRCSTPAAVAWSRTSASSTCGPSPRRPASPSTTWRSGSSTTASTHRRCRSRLPAR